MQPAVSDKIIYEHPLNEKTRTFLRLEHLFRQVDFHIPQSSTWDSRAAITSLMDMVAIFSRADIKTDLIKELKRHQEKLASIRAIPDINEERLDQILHELNGVSSKLQQHSGQLGQELRENEFLKSITQRSSIPGGVVPLTYPCIISGCSSLSNSVTRRLLPGGRRWNRSLPRSACCSRSSEAVPRPPVSSLPTVFFNRVWMPSHPPN